MKNFPDWFFYKTDWQEKTLGDFYENISAGKSKPDKNGKIILYGSTGIIGKCKQAEYFGEKILIARVGSIGNINYVKESCGITDNTLIINDVCSEINLKFLYYCLCIFNFDKLKAGTSQKLITSSQLKNLKIPFPPLEVQKKIADYFTSLDNAITAQEIKLQSWRDAKKAMLQKIFSQEFYFTQDNGEKYPAWQEKNLGEVAPLQRGFDLPSTKLKNGKYPVIYSNGILNYHDSYKCEGEAVITGRSGTIGKVFYLENCKYWAHNTTLWVTDFKNNCPKFIYYLFQTVPIKNYSAGTGVPTLNRNDLHEHILKIPCLDEQKKIADYFGSLDKIIDTESKVLENLRLMKRGLLQKLFV